MGVEENKENIRRQVEECWNKGDLSGVSELISPNYVYHALRRDRKGHDGFKEWVTVWRTACPDYHMTIDEIVGEDDAVSVRLSWTATFTGDFMDIPPTGNKISMTEARFYHFKDGKDLGPSLYGNWPSLFQQMGIPPPTEKIGK